VSGKTILLVEDHEDNRNVYRTILKLSGYEVLEALNGEEGVRMAREHRPDLILMDVAIPLIDGWEATEILKADPVTSAIPILALTALAGDEHRQRARDVGCDGFLAKPVEPRRVVREVARFLEQAEPASATEGGVGVS
jgi:two-component system, cell cycle response regulator DivK